MKNLKIFIIQFSNTVGSSSSLELFLDESGFLAFANGTNAERLCELNLK
jgi:hypothetical protein